MVWTSVKTTVEHSLEVTAEAALDTAVTVVKAPAKVTNLVVATLEGLALQLETAVERLAEACLFAFEVVVVLFVVGLLLCCFVRRPVCCCRRRHAEALDRKLV